MKQWTKPMITVMDMSCEDVIRTSNLVSSTSGKGISLDWSEQYEDVVS